MIEVTNLKIEASGKVLVDEISFKLSENESLGIIGSSGSGKTLTSLSLMGLLDEEIYKISGSIKLFEFQKNRWLKKYFQKYLLSIKIHSILFLQ